MKNAGEVAVNMMDYVTDFEKNSISLLRHADKIFDMDSHCDLPPTLQRLFGQTNNRSKIVDFLNVFAFHSIRPVVRHQPNCACIGADENVFSNLLKLALNGQDNEAMILGSLLVRGHKISTLVEKATVVALMIDAVLKNNESEFYKSTMTQKYVN